MIIVKLKGGLGNQMFQYALGRVLSIKNSTELVFNIEDYTHKTSRSFTKNMPARDFNLDIFNINGRTAEKKEIPFIYRMYFRGKIMLLIDALRRRLLKNKAQENHFEKFNSKFLDLGLDVYLDGFFQSPKYFEGYEDIIRKDFTLKKEPKENIKLLAEEISSSRSLCVHVRRGDFINNKYHDILDKDYYKKALGIILQKTTIEKIYVFSDDIKWCEENIKFDQPTMFVGEEYVGEKSEGHMFLMSKCQNFIIPNSTFSWWGAWLSIRENKVVIAPKRWFGDPSVDTSDLIPKEWISI